MFGTTEAGCIRKEPRLPSSFLKVRVVFLFVLPVKAPAILSHVGCNASYDVMHKVVALARVSLHSGQLSVAAITLLKASCCLMACLLHCHMNEAPPSSSACGCRWCYSCGDRRTGPYQEQTHLGQGASSDSSPFDGAGEPAICQCK